MNKPIFISGKEGTLLDIQQYKSVSDLLGTTLRVAMDPADFSSLMQRDYLPITGTGIRHLDNELVYIGCVDSISDQVVHVTFICKNPIRLIKTN